MQVADESPVVLNGFGTVINSLGQRAKPYLPQICGTIKWRLNNKSAKIRQQVRARAGGGGWCGACAWMWACGCPLASPLRACQLVPCTPVLPPDLPPAPCCHPLPPCRPPT